MPINTDKTINANRPDIVIKDNKDNKCWLIDLSVPSDKNIGAKKIEKLSKYKDLEIEITKMWQMKTTTIPIIVGALGIVRKSLTKHVKKLPTSLDCTQIQKIVLLGTAHILRRVLSISL